MEELYRESQKFNQWWVWLLILFSAGIGVFAGWYEWMQSGDLAAALLGIGVGGGVAILMALIQLRTTITKDGIEIKFWPFAKRRIFRSEIAEARVRKYSPIKEYGGWGYRIGAQGKAFNMSGNMGLQLRLKNGERLLIGTQRPEELAEFMAAYMADDFVDDEEDSEAALELRELREEKLRNQK